MTATRSTDDQQRGGSAVILFCDKSAYEFLAAITALIAGHKTAGGWIQNPPSATIMLCLNEIGTAVGTTSSGDTTCIIPGQTYFLTPSAGAVSVISSDNLHPFSGIGLQ